MVHILLMILKIIGIILAAILGILLLLILTILLVPVRYTIDLRKDSPELKKSKAKITVSYLLHFLHVTGGWYDEALHAKVKILGITILGMFADEKIKKEKEPKKKKKEKKPKKEKTPKQKKEKNKTEEKAKLNVIDAESNADEPQPIKHSSKEFAMRIINYDRTEDEVEKPSIDDDAEPSEPTRFEILLEKIDHLLKTISKKIESVKGAAEDKYNSVLEKIESIEEKVEDTIKKIEHYKDFSERDYVRISISLVLKEIIKLLKKIIPRKVRGSVHYGFDDPSQTGEVLGLIAAMYGRFPNKLNIRPDFEEKILEGELHLKGKIKLIWVVIPAVKLFFNKTIKKTWKQYKKEFQNI